MTSPFDPGADAARAYLRSVWDELEGMPELERKNWWMGFISTVIGSGAASVGAATVIKIVDGMGPQLIEVQAENTH